MSQYFATCAKGIEPVTAEELRRLGAENVTSTHGGVSFEGDLALLYRANLYLRTATRVLMPIKEFSAKHPEMLYDQVRRIKWDQYLNPETTFSVDCTISGLKSLSGEGSTERGLPRPLQRPSGPPNRMNNSKGTALKIKDAIVDQLRAKYGARPNIDRENPDLKINAYLNGGRCTLSFDASGNSLHERGYRLEDTGAPLKETLAAAIIEMSGWDPETPFIDPMCGSGTLALEASLKALKIAPGMFRKNFGFMGWQNFDPTLWETIVNQAQEQELEKSVAPIVGYDQSSQSIAIAIENAKNAMLDKVVHFEKRSIERLEPIGKKPGTLIVNPPYGERLGEEQELQALYKLLGDLFKQKMKGWTAYIFTGNLELAKHVGLRTSKRDILFNGPIECRLLRYELY